MVRGGAWRKIGVEGWSKDGEKLEAREEDARSFRAFGAPCSMRPASHKSLVRWLDQPAIEL